jgi:hypothetical protein
MLLRRWSHRTRSGSLVLELKKGVFPCVARSTCRLSANSHILATHATMFYEYLATEVQRS